MMVILLVVIDAMVLPFQMAYKDRHTGKCGQEKVNVNRVCFGLLSISTGVRCFGFDVASILSSPTLC